MKLAVRVVGVVCGALLGMVPTPGVAGESDGAGNAATTPASSAAKSQTDGAPPEKSATEDERSVAVGEAETSTAKAEERTNSQPAKAPPPDNLFLLLLQVLRAPK